MAGNQNFLTRISEKIDFSKKGCIISTQAKVEKSKCFLKFLFLFCKGAVRSKIFRSFYGKKKCNFCLCFIPSYCVIFTLLNSRFQVLIFEGIFVIILWMDLVCLNGGKDLTHFSFIWWCKCNIWVGGGGWIFF